MTASLVWAGVDVGKAHHWVCVVDENGVVVLSRRPGRIKSQHLMRFPSHGDGRPSPFVVRSLPEFNTYFSLLWDELDVHVEG